jgi:anti-sigma-K factor RskA
MKTRTELPNEAEALLPWYVTGRLAVDDRLKIATALETDEDLALQMRLINEDRHATIRLNEDLGAPSNAVWERIAGVVAAEPRGVSWGERLGRWLGLGAGAPHLRLAWVAAAVGIAIVLQSAAIFLLWPSTHATSGFLTASAPAAVATGAQALVSFAPETRLDQVGALLAQIHATIVEGPRSGFYKLRFADGPLDKPALDAVIAKLRASNFVKTVLPAGSGG